MLIIYNVHKLIPECFLVYNTVYNCGIQLVKPIIPANSPMLSIYQFIS